MLYCGTDASANLASISFGMSGFPVEIANETLLTRCSFGAQTRRKRR
jgi:hypothetical protein